MSDDDKALTAEDWDRANFFEAIRRMPPPVKAYDDGVVCPWCGEFHRTITFGANACGSCSREFLFGYPPWDASSERPFTWVHFPHREWEALGKKPHLLEDWKPNDRLKVIYDYWKSHAMDEAATHRFDGVMN
jgi:hypothetical protein